MNPYYVANLFNIAYSLFSMNIIAFTTAINKILIKIDCMN